MNRTDVQRRHFRQVDVFEWTLARNSVTDPKNKKNKKKNAEFLLLAAILGFKPASLSCNVLHQQGSRGPFRISRTTPAIKAGVVRREIRKAALTAVDGVYFFKRLKKNVCGMDRLFFILVTDMRRRELIH